MSKCQDIPIEKQHQNLDLRIDYLTRISIDLQNLKEEWTSKTENKIWETEFCNDLESNSKNEKEEVKNSFHPPENNKPSI